MNWCNFTGVLAEPARTTISPTICLPGMFSTHFSDKPVIAVGHSRAGQHTVMARVQLSLPHVVEDHKTTMVALLFHRADVSYIGFFGAGFSVAIFLSGVEGSIS